MQSGGYALIPSDWCPNINRRLSINRDTSDVHAQKDDHMKNNNRAAIHKPMRKVSEKTYPIGTLILDLKTPEISGEK